MDSVQQAIKEVALALGMKPSPAKPAKKGKK